MANLMRSIATRPWYAISNSIAVGWASDRVSISAKIFSASSGFILVISLTQKLPAAVSNIGHQSEFRDECRLLLERRPDMWKQQMLDLSRPKLHWCFAGPAERAGAPWPRRRPMVMPL